MFYLRAVAVQYRHFGLQRVQCVQCLQCLQSLAGPSSEADTRPLTQSY